MFSTIETFDRVLTINNIDVPVRIDIKVAEDDIDINDDYDNGTPEEIEAYRRRFQQGGDLFIAVVCVEATALDEVGTDILGGCHTHYNNMFNSGPFDEDVKAVVRDHDMVNTALEELKANIKARATTLKPYAE